MNHGGNAFDHDHHGAVAAKAGPRSPSIELGFDVSRATQNILRLLESSHGPHSSMYVDTNAPSWHKQSKRIFLDVSSAHQQEQIWSVQSAIQKSADRRDAFQKPTSSLSSRGARPTPSALESIHWSDDRTCLVKLRAMDGSCRYVSLLRLDFLAMDDEQSTMGMPPQPGTPLPNDGWVIVRELVAPVAVATNDYGGNAVQAMTGVLECLQSYLDIEHGGGLEDRSNAETVFHPVASLLTVGTNEHKHTHLPIGDNGHDLWSAPSGHFLEISRDTYLDGVASQAPHSGPLIRSQDRICHIDVDESGMVASAIVRVGNGSQTLVFEDHLLLGRSPSSSSSWQILSKIFSTQAWTKSSATGDSNSKNRHHSNSIGSRLFHSSSHQSYSRSSSSPSFFSTPTVCFSTSSPPPSNTTTPPMSFSAYLSNQIKDGKLKPDKAQQRVAQRLSRLEDALVGYNNSVLFQKEDEKDSNGSKEENGDAKMTGGDKSFCGSTIKHDQVHSRKDQTLGQTESSSIANNDSDDTQPAETTAETVAPRIQIPRGLYIHGPVGTGKSMLMDAFYDTVDIKPEERKRRYHFHNFLSIVHDRIHQLKQEDLKTKGRNFSIDTSISNNPIYRVGMQLSSEMSLLCLDEFQVTDIADAVILSQLFSVLFQQGTVVVATSNRPPEDLYEGGLNRGYFLPFIDLLKRHCIVCPMKSEQDYRRLLSLSSSSESPSSVSQLPSFFITNSDLDGDKDIDHVVSAVAEDLGAGDVAVSSNEFVSVELSVGHNRTMVVDQVYRIPATSSKNDDNQDILLACLSFDDLCDADRGAMDYRVIANSFDVVVVKNVPVMDTEGHNRARRFITLIDELYESKCALLLHCAEPSSSPSSTRVGSQLVIESPIDLFVAINRGDSTNEEDDYGKSADSDGGAQEGEENEGGLMVEWVDVAQQGGTPIGALASVRELSFAFQRASSRIFEMTSRQWWNRQIKG
jgi:predicted ATPase